jgi:hypothetical protein
MHSSIQLASPREEVYDPKEAQGKVIANPVLTRYNATHTVNSSIVKRKRGATAA